MKQPIEDTQYLRKQLKGKQIKGEIKDYRLTVHAIGYPLKSYTIEDVICYTDGYGPVWEFDLIDSQGIVHDEVFTLSQETVLSILSI